jgi:hypothetical protein
MKIGAVTPGELRAVCEKGLLLVTITIPEMEVNFIFFTDQFCGRDFISLPVPIISFSFLLAILPKKMSYIAFGLYLQHILWPFLLKMIIPQTYTGAVAMVKVLCLVFYFF